MIRDMTQADPREDPRRLRTRADLMAAFFSLVLSQRYHEIRVGDVLARSGVSRSTFYEHFRNKDELLAASLDGPFRTLANLVGERADANAVHAVLEHFWQNRALARSLFQGAALRIVRRALVMHVENTLTHEQHSRLRIPPRLAAHGLADGLFSPVVAWLSGEAKCGAQELAVALRCSTAAAAHALQTGMPVDR